MVRKLPRKQSPVTGLQVRLLFSPPTLAVVQGQNTLHCFGRFDSDICLAQKVTEMPGRDRSASSFCGLMV